VLTLVALIVALFVLPAPWNWIVVITAAVVDLLETGWMVAWSRRRAHRARPSVGVEDLVGRAGVAATELAPDGQVRVQGEIWAARSGVPVDRGAAVVVRGVDGLVLDVEPAAAPEPQRS
jgi:membrane-bound serine protease (ClpP class)